MINARLKSRFFHSDFIRYLLTALILTICSAACSTPPGNFESRDPASKAAIAATVPILQKFYFDQAPIRQASSAYPLVDSLPGGKFKPGFQPHSVAYDSNGTLLLAPGDYVIPVMTYCMDTEGSSPSGAVYRLSELQGTRAELIKKLNQKAFPRFSSHDVQILSWSLQAGLSYEELPEKSQQIFDAVFPERRNDIQESFIKKFRQEWDRISNKANGLFPSFDESSDNVLDHMGEVGLKIRALREFQSDLKQHGDDYSRLSRMIDVSKSIFQASKVTPWSKINDRVYARFVTDGQFQEMGQIQVRVVSTQERGLSSSGSRFVPVNISSWVADPMNFHIQPLSFSTILSAEGILLVPQIAEAPVIAAALLVAVLASDNIDWDSFQQLKNFLVNVKDSQVRDLIRYGNTALNKVYDDLEKPVKDAGIIDKTAKKTPNSSDSDTREYKKSDGVEQLEKDFEKLPGESKIAVDGTQIKELPNGQTAVIRIDPKKQPFPTLEIQPQQTGVKASDRLRVKVRYEP